MTLMPSTATPCQIKPYPTRHLPRNNAPLNLPRSHEKACAAHVCRVHVHDPFLNSLPIPKKFCVSEEQHKTNRGKERETRREPQLKAQIRAWAL